MHPLLKKNPGSAPEDVVVSTFLCNKLGPGRYMEEEPSTRGPCIITNRKLPISRRVESTLLIHTQRTGRARETFEERGSACPRGP